MAENGALVVCVPNFSEGRQHDVIDAICDALAGGGARLVYRQADPEHNRLDTTVVGSPDAVDTFQIPLLPLDEQIRRSA